MLIAESDLDVREVLADALAEQGFSVLEAANADEAILLLRAQSMDVLVIHWGLYQTRWDHFRTFESERPIMRLVFTTSAADAKALRRPRAPMIQKPFRPSELVQAIFDAETTPARR